MTDNNQQGRAQCVSREQWMCEIHGSMFGQNVRCDFSRPTEHVYAISEIGTNMIKIGKALDPVSRVADLQTGNPRPLHLLFHSEPVTYALELERCARNMVAEQPGAEHAHGEWVRIDSEEALVWLLHALTDIGSWQAIELHERAMPVPV